MKRVRLTMSQALVQFLDNQYIECDGVESKFVSGIFGIFGHGCVVGVGQALEQGGHNLKFYQGTSLSPPSYSLPAVSAETLFCRLRSGRGQNAQKAAVFPRCLG